MFDLFFYWKIFVLWMHVITASIWLGGLILTTVLNRTLRKSLGYEESYKVVRMVGYSFQKTMRYSLYIAILTGILNVLNDTYFNLNFIFSQHFIFSNFGILVILKSAIALFVLIFAIYHTNIARLIPKMKENNIVIKLRKRITIVGWIAMILTFIFFLLGTILVFIV